MYSIAMYRVLCILFAVFISSPVFAQTKTVKDDFVSGFEDLPLMTGLIQLEDGAVSFDSPSGRIVEAYAESPTLTVEKILTFYSDALPQLGWKKDGNGSDFKQFVFRVYQQKQAVFKESGNRHRTLRSAKRKTV